MADINQRKNLPAFVFPIEDSYKFIFLDGEKHTNKNGKNGLFPSPLFDNGKEILLTEGLADCIKARELGFNAFTWSGGSHEQGKVGACFKERKFIVCLDVDDPSKKALPKVLEILSEQGHQVASVELPFLEHQKGKDLCDWLQYHTKEEFLALEPTPYKPIPKTSDSKNSCFWRFVRSKKPDKDTGEYSYAPKIDLLKLLQFIENNGFTPMWIPNTNESIFIRIQNNIVEEVTPLRIKEFVLDWIAKNVPNQLDFEYADFYQKDLTDTLIAAENVYFSTSKLQCILSKKPLFHKDTRKEASFYFKNGFVTVSKDSITPKPYSELNGVIWKKQIIQRDFTPEDSNGEYAGFLWNVCNREQDRFTALCSAIGYLLHRFKDPANAKAVILVDEKVSDSPEGGTGKSLIATALGELRNVTKIDGKDFDFDNRFAFQDVGLDTDTVVFDDIGAKFPFERLFHKITDGMETERKGQNRIKRPFEDSPKFLLTTNYTVQGEGGSAERRKVEYELFGHYSKTFTPRDEVGHNFFDEWDEKEWAKFDTFMLERVKLFLSLGLQTYKHKNLDQRKIVQETSQEFFEFMDDFFYKTEGVEKREFNKSLLDKEISIPELMKDFCSWSPDHKNMSETKKFPQSRFTKWLKSYAKHSELKIKTGRNQANKENRYQFIRFSK
jgi:hypothetical protein